MKCDNISTGVSCVIEPVPVTAPVDNAVLIKQRLVYLEGKIDKRRKLYGLDENVCLRQHQNRSRCAHCTSKYLLADSKLKVVAARYGITLKELRFMHAQQDALCAICNHFRKLGVDHCHQTGKVRFLLCAQCNSYLGLLEADDTMIERLVDYVKMTREVKQLYPRKKVQIPAKDYP